MRLSYKDNNGTLEIIDEIDKVDSPNTIKYFKQVRQNNYYPFGLKHKGYNTNITSTNIALKRKFGGKEYQYELGLDWYDITARNYSLSPTQLGNPALGRWMNIDPGRALKKCPVDIFSEGASLSRGQIMRRCRAKTQFQRS